MNIFMLRNRFCVRIIMRMGLIFHCFNILMMILKMNNLSEEMHMKYS